MSKDELLTRKQAAQMFRCNESTIWRWRKMGIIKAYGVGGKVYYKQSELEQVLLEL